MTRYSTTVPDSEVPLMIKRAIIEWIPAELG